MCGAQRWAKRAAGGVATGGGVGGGASSDADEVFACHKCGKTFSRLSVLARHSQLEHAGEWGRGGHSGQGHAYDRGRRAKLGVFRRVS